MGQSERGRRRLRRRVLAGMAAAVLTATASDVLAASASGPTAASAKLRDTFDFVLSSGSSGSGNGRFVSPDALAVGPEGNLYVADFGNSRVQVFDRRGRFLRAIGQPKTGKKIEYPNAVAVAPNGDVFVGSQISNQLYVYSSTGKYLRRIGATGSGSAIVTSPIDLAVHDGLLYVTDNDGFVKIFSLSGTYKRKVGHGGSKTQAFGLIGAMAVGPTGTIYVTDRFTDEFQAIPAAGDSYKTTMISDVTGLAVRSDGRVFIGSDGNTVDVLTADLDLVGYISGTGDSGFANVTGVAIDRVGNLWLSDSYNNRIQLWGDATKPTIIVKTPPTGAIYPKGRKVEARYSCSDATTGVERCRGTVAAGARIDTSKVGTSSFSVTATDRTGNTSTVKRKYVVQMAKPDATVRVGSTGKPVGNDIYGSAAKQSVSAKVSAGRSVTYYVVLQNDAGFADRVRLRGPAGSSGFAIEYRSGPYDADVTKAMVDGSFRTPTLAPGEFAVVSVTVTAAAAAPGATLSTTLTATSSTHSKRTDTVAMTTGRS